MYKRGMTFLIVIGMLISHGTLFPALAETGPQTASELREIMSSCPARYRRFGKEILEISRLLPADNKRHMPED